MRIIALICAVVLALSSPALAQNPPVIQPDGQDALAQVPDNNNSPPPTINPTVIGLGLVAGGLAAWGIVEATKNKSATPGPSCQALHPTTAATDC